ncbi:MAG: amino acid permease [Acidobacteriota bacterium]
MPKTVKRNSKVTFARDLGLFDATMIGIGAMIGAGIFVLTGIAAGQAGPASLLAFGLNGAVTLLTAFAYAELASAIPRAGGGYSFVRMAFPGSAGFVAGWMLWFAYTVACSLYALGFAGYFWEFFHTYSPHLTALFLGMVGRQPAIVTITLLVGMGFIWLNARGAEVTGKAENALTLSKLLILSVFVSFGIAQILREPDRALNSLTPFFPTSLGGVLIAMGLTFIAFEGYDLIATVAEEIKNPEKNIPRATFIALGVTIVLYLLILLVSLAAIDAEGMASWQFLGKYKETAIVRAAESFMPAVGVTLIVFGGLLSTMSALNATVMAASRVAFSMGRDLWLPKRFSIIHPVRRTPQVAIFTTGILMLGMAATLPIEAVGSAASVMFLLTFALVNLAVITLRRKYPELPRRYQVPLYPVVPVLGFSLNIFLAVYQFNFAPLAWYVTAGWIALGLLLYYAIFEKRASSLEPQVLLPRRPAAEVEEETCVMVALHNPDNARILLDLGWSMARQRGVRLVAVSVVQVPRQMPIHEGMRFAHHKEALLHRAKREAKEQEQRVATDLVIAHRASDGVLAAAERHYAEALVMGWKGFTNARDRVFGEIADRIIRLAPCDLLLLKAGERAQVRTCLLPTAGGPNARLAASVLSAFAKEKNLSVTAAYVVPEQASPQRLEEAQRRVDQTMKETGVGL